MEKSNKTMIGAIQTRCVMASVTIETRAGNDPDVSMSRTISGCAVRFNEWSKPFWGEWVEMVDPHAFDACDMSDVVMCVDHSNACTDVLARKRGEDGTLTLSIDEQGVRFSFEAPHTSAGDDLLELVRRGDISECSFKFSVEADAWMWKNSQNGLQYDQRTITKMCKLYDLSLVISGQYSNTSATAERSVYAQMRKLHTTPSCNMDTIKARDFLNGAGQNL